MPNPRQQQKNSHRLELEESLREVRQRLLDADPEQTVENAIIRAQPTRNELTGRDQRILGRIHSQFALMNGPINFDKFSATRIDFQMTDMSELHLSQAIHAGGEEEVLEYMHRLFHDLLQRVRALPVARDDDVIHMYLQTEGVDFMFSLDYAGRDRMTLGGLLSNNTGMLDTMLDNFASIIQSGSEVVLNEHTSIRIWLFHTKG